MRAGVEAGQADDRAPCVGSPVRREQPGEGGHEVDAIGVLDRGGERLALRRVADHAELVAQPLHGRTGHRDRPLERVDSGLRTELVAHRGEQPGAGPDDLGPGVQQQEVARAVSVLGLAGAQADLADGGGVLVAQRAGDRQISAERAVVCCQPVGFGGRGRQDPRQHLPRHGEEPEQLLVPVQGDQVHQHGAAGVGDVGHVHAAPGAAGEVPQQPGVDGAEDGLAAFGVGAQAVEVVEHALQLAAGEVGGQGQARLVPDHLAAAVPVQAGGDPVGPGVLPDDGVPVRPPGAPVPRQRGFPLVGQAQGDQVGGAQAGCVQALFDDGAGPLPDLGGVVLHPAGPGHDLRVLQLVPGHFGAGMVEDHEPGTRGALIDRPDEIGHSISLWWRFTGMSWVADRLTMYIL